MVQEDLWDPEEPHHSSSTLLHCLEVTDHVGGWTHSPCVLDVPVLRAGPTLLACQSCPASVGAERKSVKLCEGKWEQRRVVTHPATLVPFGSGEAFTALQAALSLNTQVRASHPSLQLCFSIWIRAINKCTL